MLGLVSEDLLGGVKAIHNWHHKVHDCQLEVLFGAFWVRAFVVETVFKLVESLLPISRFFWEDLVINLTSFT